MTPIASLPGNASQVSIKSWKELDNSITPLIERIEQLCQKRLSHIIYPVMKHWFQDLKDPPYILTAMKIVSLPAYASLLGVGFLTTVASGDLLFQAQYPQALSSDTMDRVDFANTFTNVGALFACITDLPAISYVFYVLNFQKAHVDVSHEVLDKAYFEIMEDLEIDPHLREQLYMIHLEKLQSFGVDRFYLRPDPNTEIGNLYRSLTPLLEKIDQKIENAASWQNSYCDLWNHFKESMKTQSCSKKLVKGALGALCLGTWALSAFLIWENGVLLVSTPVEDLFSRDSDRQESEAFYITQVGGAFSALTAFGAAACTFWFSSLQTPFKKMMIEKIKSSFEQSVPEDLSLDESRALLRIKNLKLRPYH